MKQYNAKFEVGDTVYSLNYTSINVDVVRKVRVRDESRMFKKLDGSSALLPIITVEYQFEPSDKRPFVLVTRETYDIWTDEKYLFDTEESLLKAYGV